jgi:hypothetical protein
MLTRSASKALHADRYDPFFVMYSSSLSGGFNCPRVTIYNHSTLPEDVLLEIFDAFRQLHELQPNYETLWSSRDGWFKLAHVCLHWRRILLLSPSRLHLHLVLTPYRPSRGPLLRCLPRLPIWVDYTSAASWTTRNEESLALAVMGHRSRVRGITLGSCPDQLLSALTRPFPKLESLDICSVHRPWCQLVLPAMCLPSLQHLTLRGVEPSSLSPLLSSATGLVELALTLSVEYRALPEYSLIANLQRMSCLRRLELKLSYLYQGITITPSQPPPARARFAVSLSKLTDLIFIGHCSYLQMLVVGLAAPSLQRLDAEIYRTSPNLSVPHLCKFIRATGNKFVALSFNLFQEKLQFSADTTDHTQSFRIIFPQPFVPLEEIGNMLSRPLSTVEELVIECHLRHEGPRVGLFTQHYIQWRGFFNHIRRVKTVQVPFEVAHDVAHSFQQGGLEDLLPTLEQLKVDVTHLLQNDWDTQFKTICSAFEPLITARRQAGRPIVLSRV